MAQQIRVTVESLDDAGCVISKDVVMTKVIVKPDHIVDLGLRHAEQVDLLRHVQQKLLDNQSIFLKDDSSTCPKCSGRLHKSGSVKSDFHAIFTDHKIAVGRKVCKSCNWTSTPSIRSLFGNASHPDLIKIQAELGANHTFRHAQKLMNLFSNIKRSINSHDRVKRITEAVGNNIAQHPIPNPKNIKPAPHLYVQVDGGHVATTEEDKRSFEAMTAVVFEAKNIQYTGGKEKEDGSLSTVRGQITSKHCAASSLSDDQKVMKQQTLNAAIKQGMTTETRITAICDGATNCWNIIASLENSCYSIERILDWHHIAMKFQNTRLGQNHLNEQLSGAKWYLWHGLASKAIERLKSIQGIVQDDDSKKKKVQDLLTYIENNVDYIINYQKKQEDGLIFTSQMAESTVESLINQRCKGQQHMRWSRGGLHALLQIRAAINSDDWGSICEQHINDAIYQKVA